MIMIIENKTYGHQTYNVDALWTGLFQMGW